MECSHCKKDLDPYDIIRLHDNNIYHSSCRDIVMTKMENDKNEVLYPDLHADLLDDWIIDSINERIKDEEFDDKNCWFVLYVPIPDNEFEIEAVETYEEVISFIRSNVDPYKQNYYGYWEALYIIDRNFKSYKIDTTCKAIVKIKGLNNGHQDTIEI